MKAWVILQCSTRGTILGSQGAKPRSDGTSAPSPVCCGRTIRTELSLATPCDGPAVCPDGFDYVRGLSIAALRSSMSGSVQAAPSQMSITNPPGIPLKNGCRTLPSADLARYSISASNDGSTQTPRCAIFFA